MPNERVTKSASVVPTVVLATIVVQYSHGLKRRARICMTTATPKITAKIRVPSR